MIKCDWNNNEERDTCQRCGIVPDEMWFIPSERSPYEGSGRYYCKPCAELIEKNDD